MTYARINFIMAPRWDLNPTHSGDILRKPPFFIDYMKNSARNVFNCTASFCFHRVKVFVLLLEMRDKVEGRK